MITGNILGFQRMLCWNRRDLQVSSFGELSGCMWLPDKDSLPLSCGSSMRYLTSAFSITESVLDYGSLNG